MDVHTLKQRSFNMSQIKSKNTKPEILLRKLLCQNGFRYRLHYKNLPGNPDVVFPGKKKVIFINGCFWHRHNCRFFKWPEINVEFWKNKINGNVKRDKKNYKKLKDENWDYFIVWECEIKKGNMEKLENKIRKFLGNIL